MTSLCSSLPLLPLILTFVLVATTHSGVREIRWEPLATTNGDRLFVDHDSILKKADGSISLSFKWLYTGNKASRFGDSCGFLYEANGTTTAAWKKFSYVIERSEFNCDTRVFFQKTRDYYDSNQTLIYHIDVNS